MLAMSATVKDRGERGFVVRVYSGGTDTQVATFKGTDAEAQANDLAKRINESNAALEKWGNWREGEPIPISALLRGWQVKYAELRSERTVATDRARVDRLVEWFGDVDARSLHEGICRDFAIETMKSRSASVACGCLSILRRVLNLATKSGGLPRNPVPEIGTIIEECEALEADEVETPDAWSYEEAELLLKLAREHEPHFYPALRIAFATGMRRGEILALKWSEIDLFRKRVEVKRTAKLKGGTKVPKRRKRRSPSRIIPLSDADLALLREHKRQQERSVLKGATESDWVFPSPQGFFWAERNFSRMWERLRRLAKRRDVRPLKFHCTRHTFITWALEAGKPITRVAYWVDSSVKVIEDRYRHVLPSENEDMSFVSPRPRPDQDRTKPGPNRTKGRSKVTRISHK